MALFLASLTAGCSVGGGSGPAPDPPPPPIPPLEPAAQPFGARTTFVDNVLSVDVRYHDGRTRTLDTVRNYEAEWGLLLPQPSQPGHTSREWLLSENHYDGKIMLYAVVSWNDADPTDYLAAGWWLVYPPGVSYQRVGTAAMGVFIDGPELDPAAPPDVPLTGTATFVGGAGGLYQYYYGRAWGELADESEYTEFQGPISLTANFDEKEITGCLGCLDEIETTPGRHLFPIVSSRSPDVTALPADYDLHFAASFDAKGAFEDTDITVTHPERTIAAFAGTWRGQFSNVSDVDGNPRRVVGSTEVQFAETDGSFGRFVGIFDALTPATIEPDEGSPVTEMTP
ncbi:MAG: hypothetical protein OXF11_02270 [Deltaproteobacteria bacterium]|nr:hypothetical protein [Deltaproteobacteria bacterium]